MCVWLFLLSLQIISTATNIVVTSPFAGSHLTSVWDIAVVLADQGYNVTFISLEEGSLDTLKHPNITNYVTKEHFWGRGVFGKMMRDECTTHVARSSSREMLETNNIHPGCKKVWSEAYAMCSKVFTSLEFRKLLLETNTSLIISTMTEASSASVLAASLNIPLIQYVPHTFSSIAMIHNNYPNLFSSEPGIIMDRNLDKRPSFYHRFSKLIVTVRLFFSYYSSQASNLQHVLDEYNITQDDMRNAVQLFIYNDHRSITFPTLLPPYLIQIAGMRLLDYKPKPLPFDIDSFIRSNDHPLIYVSFGTYIEPNFEWTKVLISALGKMKAKVIIKLKDNSVFLPENFLAMGWVPQVDLLASGKVDLFISHCGNNGRIELSYYNVPVLCVPLFADQVLNGEIIKFKKFGKVLLKEDIASVDIAVSNITEMLSLKDQFISALKMASEIFKPEVALNKEKLLLYVSYLVKHKNLDFLFNDVLRTQSIIEVFNLDVLGLIFLTFAVTLIIIIIAMYKLCNVFKRKLYSNNSKNKSD